MAAVSPAALEAGEGTAAQTVVLASYETAALAAGVAAALASDEALTGEAAAPTVRTSSTCRWKRSTNTTGR